MGLIPVRDSEIFSSEKKEACVNTNISSIVTVLLFIFSNSLVMSVQIFIDIHVSLSILGKFTKAVSTAKDLEITLDSHLTHNQHISIPAAKSTFILAQINRIIVKTSFDKETLSLLIKAEWC